MKQRIGWVLDSAAPRILTFPWESLSPVGLIRYGGIAQHLHLRSSFSMELYRPWSRYAAVVFVKMMNPACQALARRLQSKGTKVIFDANVNYYEDSGEYVVVGTRPTPEQQSWAVAMTSLADLVVADSIYLKNVCERYNRNVVWIPDAVDTDAFAPSDEPTLRPNNRLVLIWSGVGKKARPLELIESVLRKFKNSVTLKIVTSPDEPHNPWADVMRRLTDAGLAEIQFYDHRTYPNALHAADVIVSPRTLENAYEMAHTEYKITLGMSTGLPALSSPQPSYVEALKEGGGFICRTVDEWSEKIRWCIDHPEQRCAMGQKARERVLSNYSIPVVAGHYERSLHQLLESTSKPQPVYEYH